jgi:hypothetical protein
MVSKGALDRTNGLGEFPKHPHHRRYGVEKGKSCNASKPDIFVPIAARSVSLEK